MNSRAIHWESWELDAEDSRRFHRICAQVGITLLAVALLVPMIKLSVQQHPAAPQPAPAPAKARVRSHSSPAFWNCATSSRPSATTA